MRCIAAGFCVFWLVLTSPIQAQSPVDFNIGYAKGFILEHNPAIAHLVTSHPVSVWLSVYKKTFGQKPWQSLYNYPDAGVTMFFIDYNNPVLGNSIGFIPNYNFHFRHPARTVNGHFKTGLGLGYHTNPYDRTENNKNNVLSTSFSFGMLLQSEVTVKITDYIKLAAGISFTHFSNGSVKKPNKGINIVSLNSGATYTLNRTLPDYEDNSGLMDTDKKWQAVAVASGGMSETIKIGSGTYPFFNVLVYADRTLNAKRRAGAGLEYFHTISLREEIKIDPDVEGSPPDFRRIAFVAVYEQVFNSISVIANTGVYIYRPYKVFMPFYLRAGLRYALNENLFLGLAVKSHYFKAEAGEWSIGYRF